MNPTTPLLAFLRSIDDTAERKQFAEACGTTPVYLYQLAAQPWPSPRLKLAMALVAESKKIAKKWMARPLTLEDLLVGTAADGSIPDGPRDDA